MVSQNTNDKINYSEGVCPICAQAMTLQSPKHYHCQTCQQDYLEHYICPTCEQPADIIKGCGAVNYLCRTDGLISSRKIKFYYTAQ